MSPLPNVDPGEVAKFERVARLWWDAAGKMGMLHVINPLRAAFIAEHAPLRHAKVVDVGCGGGILAEALARAGGDVVGIDQSPQALRIAREHAAANNIGACYREQTVEQLVAGEAGTCDVVTCMEMLEHVPDPAAVVHACARLLKPGGKVFFSTINRSFKAWLFAIVGGEYVLRLLPRGTHQYARLIRPDELRAWAAIGGLVPVAAASLMYNPFARSFRVAPGREDVNYMICFARPR